MKKNKCCIVLIVYKEKLTNEEERSLKQCLKVFGGKRDIKFIIPNNMPTNNYDGYNIEYIKVNPQWLDSIKSYNHMCCDKEFYELFKDYDYMLIYQTDCWVFEDRLDYYMELGYDYYGAPWPIYRDQVGNGGFSLRKVDKMIELTTKYTYDGRLNEDGWFCLTHKSDLNICDLDNACNFSMEIIDAKYMPKIKTYPMGLHSSRVYQFWDEDGSKFIEFKKKQLDKKISIITVNLNNNVGLKKTMDSVIKQTAFKNVEYIIIDGGSTDGSKELIEQYKDKLHYYVSEKDNGIYDAMNKGINAATRDYCLFLNSGDYLYENDVIEKMIPHLIEDVVYGDLMINERSKKIYKSNIDIAYFNYESLPHPSSFIKTELLKDNLYRTDYKIISDWIFFRECAAKGKRFKHVDVVVSNFYLGGVSSSVNGILKEKRRYFNADENDCEISVIIPCYNQGKYIKETIVSLKNQIYEDFRCIIVNDGSTDNSEEVILENIKGDSRFRYFKTENKGVAHARNFGINKTNSKYILCLDADDKISTSYIECAVRHLNKHPETSLFYGNALMFYDNGEMRIWKMPNFAYKQMFVMNCIYSSCVYRRKDYVRVGGYDESMKGYEDWEFLIRLLHKNDNVYKTNDFVFYYRRHEGSRDATVKQDVKTYKQYIINKNKNIYNTVNKPILPIALIKCSETDNFYGNISDLRNIDENTLKNKEYVAVFQNEKCFDFPNITPTVSELFSQYDAIVAKPSIFKTSVREQYAKLHNVEDLEIVEKIIDEKYPNYSNSFKAFFNGKILIPYNMFIMKKEDFLEYVEFINNVLNDYLDIVGKNIYKRIVDNKDKYLKNFYPNNTIEYQYRIGGYLAERLTNVFMIKKFKKLKTYPVIITEDKYK